MVASCKRCVSRPRWAALSHLSIPEQPSLTPASIGSFTTSIASRSVATACASKRRRKSPLDLIQSVVEKSQPTSGRCTTPADFNQNRWPTSIGMPGRHRRNLHFGDRAILTNDLSNCRNQEIIITAFPWSIIPNRNTVPSGEVSHGRAWRYE
jgi:hypothetical protein